MPRYELDGEIWEIAHDDKELSILANGKSTQRKFVSADHAATQYAKLIAEKTTAGWKQVAGATTRRPSTHLDEPRELGLEQHIIDDLDNADAYSVYADWYQARQHPRGELIALQLAEETRGEDRKLHDLVEKHLVRYKVELLGPLAKHLMGGDSPFIWRNGFIHGLTFSGEDHAAEIIRDVVKHPSGRFLSSLELKIHGEGALRLALAAVTPARATLRDLYIMTGASLVGLDVIEQLPQLRTLSLATLALESVRGHGLASVAAVSATCEGLHLRFEGSGTNYWKDLAPLFDRDDLDIRNLSMRVPIFIDQILVAISEGPFARRVEKLDFGLTDPDAGMRAFLANRDRFVKLREITASLGRLTVAARTTLKQHYKVNDVIEDGLAEQIGYEEDHFDDVQE